MMDNTSKRAYIDALSESLKSQKNYVLLLMTFDLGLLALTINNLVLISPRPNYSSLELSLLSAMMTTFLLSGIFFFWWFSKLQKLSQECVDLHYSLEIEESRELHFGGKFWEKHGWIYKLGICLLWLAILFGTILTGCILLA